MADALRTTPDGIELRIRLTPRASADRIDGAQAASDGTPHLAARVRAVPEKGKANQALERLVANWIGAPPSQVRVTGGETARIKTVTVSGEATTLAARARALLAG